MGPLHRISSAIVAVRKWRRVGNIYVTTHSREYLKLRHALKKFGQNYFTVSLKTLLVFIITTIVMCNNYIVPCPRFNPQLNLPSFTRSTSSVRLERMIWPES